MLLVACSLAFAQSAQKPATYPAHGQSPQKQQQDEGACYAWAKQNTGIDPVAVSQAPPPPSGPTAARVGGAAAGTIIGAVSGNSAGHGAAVGATTGALAGGVRARHERAQEAQASQQAQSTALNTNWHAYGAYMQGRGYTVQ